MQQVPFTLTLRLSLRILSGISLTWVLLAAASPLARAECPFARVDQQPKLLELLLSGSEAFAKAKNTREIVRGIARQTPVVQTLLAKGLIHQLLPIKARGDATVDLALLLERVSDGGQSFSISRLQYPGADSLGEVYRVQIVYYSETPDPLSPDILAEHVAHLYYAKVNHTGWLAAPNAKRNVEFRLLGTVVDGQARSCFIP